VPPFNGGKYDWNLVLKGGRTAFETEITYECDVGRRFAHYTINETIYYDRKTLYCEWNRTWTPEEPVSIWSDLKEQISFIFSFKLDECEWIQCIDPPVPNGHGVKLLWDGVTPYEFYSNATYTCEKYGLWFEEDRDMTNFTLQCLPGGRWKVPRPWPRCIES
jgi:hypothetical protein